MRSLVGDPPGVISSVTICLASYALMATLVRAWADRSGRCTAPAEAEPPDQGNWLAMYPDTRTHRVSDTPDTHNLNCGNAVTMKGNTMAGLCDDPETPFPAGEDPERSAYALLADPDGDKAAAQAYATLALAQQVKELVREIHRFRTPPTMKKK